MKFSFSILFISVFTYTVYAIDPPEKTRGSLFTIHGQTTLVTQRKPSFNAPYSGGNSLSNRYESATSLTSTLYAGVRLWKGASACINPEVAGGTGLSSALGMAASSNGETFRIGNAAPQLYLARLYFTQIINLGSSWHQQEEGFNKLAVKIPDRYLSFTIGKVSIADFFDANQYSHDPRTQYMNWGLMSNGAWDYPANTRGYTPSVVLEYVSPKNELRFGVSMVPKTANGNVMNRKVSKANSSTIEYTRHYNIKKRSGTARLLAFYTTTDMGNYHQSIELSPSHPIIEDTRAYGHTKYGLCLNAEQEFSSWVGGFLRAGWNDGHNETWAFTEIDRSISMGVTFNGTKWKRPGDEIGVAVVSSGLSKPHRNYLAHGGKGFMLGDGQLNYALESLSEIYYNCELKKDMIYMALDWQFVLNPGYNADRGPVQIFSVRLHFKI